MISILGAAFVACTFAALTFKQAWLPWVLSAAVPFSATAGITVAGQSIVMYPLVAIALVGLVANRSTVEDAIGADLSTKPGLRPLVAFGIWAVLVTAVSPIVFAGTPVLDPKQGIDDGVKDPAVLAPALSNAAQAGYIAIGIATVIAIGSMRNVSPRLPAAAFAIGTIASSARFLLPETLQKVLFDNSENVTYTTGEFAGTERMRGIFSEPAGLGAFSVAAVVFFVMTASSTRGPQRYLWAGLGCWAATNAVLSFSGGALVTGLVVLGLVALQGTLALVSSSRRLAPPTVVIGLALAAVSVVLVPRVYDFVMLLLDDKASSSSYANRSAADTFSFALVDQTYWLGTGLGSNRPSSFLASLASTTGVLGVVLFASALGILLWHSVRQDVSRPVGWALIAVVISKVTAGPDTSDPSVWFLLGVCAACVWSRNTDPRSPPRGRVADEDVVLVGRRHNR